MGIFRGICRLVLLAVAIVLTVAPAHAQKIKITVDKTANFGHYKKYAWTKNYLITHQTPDDQKAIGDDLKSAINSQLTSKGFVLDETHPDFLVSYEAGGLSKVDMSTVPDLDRDPGNPNAMNQPADIGPMMTNSDAWSSVMGGLRLTFVDAASKKKVWIGQISEKIHDPQKFMNNMDAELSSVTAKLLKTFPPNGK
jgi:Domain of unknown function (DUF4136)